MLLNIKNLKTVNQGITKKELYLRLHCAIYEEIDEETNRLVHFFQGLEQKERRSCRNVKGDIEDSRDFK